MRKRICAALLCCTMAYAAPVMAAETVDLSSMTLEELQELRESLDAEILAKGGGEVIEPDYMRLEWILFLEPLLLQRATIVRTSLFTRQKKKRKMMGIMSYGSLLRKAKGFRIAERR